MKIITSDTVFSAQVASFPSGAGVFRWFNWSSAKSHNFFDVFFDHVAEADVNSISDMHPDGGAQIRVWYDSQIDFVNPPHILPHPYLDTEKKFIGELSWFLSSIGMSLKNPRTQSSSPIAAREKKRWGTAMKAFRSATPVPGNLCIPPEEWEVLRVLDENPLLYRDAEFKEWALSRSG